MDWLAQLRTLFGMTPAPMAPAYASNHGGTFIQRGISVVTAPFAPPVIDAGQAAFYNGGWFQAAFAPVPLPTPPAPTVLNGGQSIFSNGQLFTAPVLAALNSLINPPASAPSAPAPVAATPSAPAAPSAPSCNSGNFSCVRYACAPGNYSCARGVAPWYTGGNIW